MRRVSLSKLLIAINVGLVLIAVAWVVTAAVSRLERLSDEQALARVTLAGTSALQAIGRTADQVATDARLLAERPTLLRLLETRDAAGLGTFLDRFRGTTRLSGCAVLVDGTVFAGSGEAPLPGRAGADIGGCGSVLRRSSAGELRLEAACPARASRGAVVVATLALDEALSDRIAAQIGLPVTLLEGDAAMRAEEDPRYDMRSRALAGSVQVARRLDAAGVYVFAASLRDPSGEILGLVETSLATTSIVASVRGLVRSLVALSAVVIAFVIALSVLAARWLARPLETLTEAASRIGGGDLATLIPSAPGAEIGTLAASMEEMRGRLLQLTAELRHRQAETEAVLAGIAEGVYAVDPERRIRYINPQAAGLLDVAPEQAIGRFCGDLLNPQGPGGVRPCETNCPIVHARFGGQARATEQLLTAGGRRRSVVITSASYGPGSPDEDGGTPGKGRQFQVIRDETEMEAARRLRDVVLSNISHEFKTPLTAQLASIELLKEKMAGLDAAEADMLVSSLQRGTLRLTQLIDNLLESVRLEAGQRSIRRRPMALDEVIEEAVELTSPLIAHRNQSLLIDLPYPIPALTGDAARLTQVFVNLLANANKFSPEGSSISIGGSVGDAEVAVWVEDEGPGLRSSTASWLFERFVRAHGSDEEDEPEQGGMGLGLSIVKSIVERHGGRVEMREATVPGRGMRMCVILPLVTP